MSAQAPHWQSGARPAGVQKIPGGLKWTPLWTIDAEGRRVTWFACEVDGPHDIDWAVRVRPGSGRVWFRVQRHPIDASDNGTRWVGPIRLDDVHTYEARKLMDHQGGKVGHGYGVEIRAERPCVVDQVYLKLDPRHAVS